MAINFKKFADAAVIGKLALHTLKTFHGKPIKPYRDPEAPSEFNKPVRSRPSQNPVGFTNMVFAGEHMNHLEFKFDYTLRDPDEMLVYSKAELASWLKERILSQADRKSKYLKIKNLGKRSITIVFHEELWIQDTLKGTRPHLGYFKTKVFIPWKLQIPDVILTKYARPFLGPFLSKKVNQYFRRNRQAMKFQNYFKFLDKINPDFFEYGIEWYRSEFMLTLKNTVILGALLAAFGIRKALR